MQTKLLSDAGGLRTFVVVLETGEETLDCLKRFVDREKVSAAQLTAIGAFSGAVLGYFDWETKDYARREVGEQVEVASLLGDVALAPGGEASVHLHAVLGRRDGSALAGHLLSGAVRPTLEVIVNEAPAHLRKRRDPVSGLALIRPEEG